MIGRTSILAVSTLLLALPASAQQPPDVTPGYATEGRPGFVYVKSANALGWEPLEIAGMPPGMSAKVLSRDAQRGGLALLSRRPAGWRHDQRGYHSNDEEIFLLEGDLTIGDQQLTRYSYAFFPAGVVHGPVATQQGAVFLQWFKARPDFVAAAGDAPGARAHATVRDWHFHEQPWEAKNFPVYRKGPLMTGIRKKLLRRDPDTGEMTWITHSTGGPGGFGAPVTLSETHPTFEEYFLLELSAERRLTECLPEGLTELPYEEHGYWWRPAGVGHAGLAFSGESLSLVRTGDVLWADYFTDCSYQEQVEFSEHGLKYLPPAR
jgi:hypothetical protein